MMRLTSGNNLIDALKSSDAELLRPHLTPVEIARGYLMYEPGDQVDLVYFPCDAAMAGYFVQLPDGKGVETALVGREGAIGGIVSQGTLPAYARCTAVCSGTFLTVPTKQLAKLKEQSASFHYLFARYADCLIAQIFQTTACNAAHTINQRAAKWMLATMERSGCSTISITQDQMAEMLGIGRSYISRVIAGMKENGLIRVSRRKIFVDDHNALKAKSCDCNDSIKRHFDAILKGVYPECDF